MTMEEVAVQLNEMKVVLHRLESRLLGNGQPGDIEKMNTRITRTEERLIFARGAIWAIGAALSLAVGGGLLHVFKIGIR